jgi:vacuolar ATPase assembly integral membrane protein VMA21
VFLSKSVTGNATYAGGLAAIMANVVLIAYVIVAMKEDQSEKLEAEVKAKKAQ